MGALVIPQRWVKQPQFLTGIDRNNSLGKGLIHVQTGAQLDRWTPTGSVGVNHTTVGLSRTYVAASTQWLSQSSVIQYPLTFAVLARRAAAAAVHSLISCGEGTGISHLIYFGSDDKIHMFSIGAGSAEATSTATFTSTTAFYNVAGRVAGNAQRDIWVDGVQQATNTGSQGSTAASTTLAVGAYYKAGAAQANFYMNGDIALACAWDRYLGDDELVAFYKNPWQVFAPYNDRVYFNAVAAGFKPYWASQRSRVIGAGVI